MIPLRRQTRLVLAAACAAPFAVPAAFAQDALGQERGQVMRVAERCDVYGPGFVDIGNGACGQIVNTGRIRADNPGPRDWSGAGTSNAALRSGTTGEGDGLGMVRGAAGAQHLRIGDAPYGR